MLIEKLLELIEVFFFNYESSNIKIKTVKSLTEETLRLQIIIPVVNPHLLDWS